MNDEPAIHISMIARIVAFDVVRQIHHTNYLTVPEELQDIAPGPQMDDYVRTLYEATNLPSPEWYEVARLNPLGEWETLPRVLLKQ